MINKKVSGCLTSNRAFFAYVIDIKNKWTPILQFLKMYLRYGTIGFSKAAFKLGLIFFTVIMFSVNLMAQMLFR